MLTTINYKELVRRALKQSLVRTSLLWMESGATMGCTALLTSMSNLTDSLGLSPGTFIRKSPIQHFRDTSFLRFPFPGIHHL